MEELTKRLENRKLHKEKVKYNKYIILAMFLTSMYFTVHYIVQQ